MVALPNRRMPENNSFDEWSQVLRAQADQQAFAPLYEAYWPQIVRYLYRRLPSLDLARDLAADAFVQAITHIRSLKAKDPGFGPWMYTIARNQLLQWVRKNPGDRVVSLNDQEALELVQAAQPDAHYPGDDLLFAALSNLPPQELELIEWRFFEKKSFHDMALITGISEAAVKMRVYRILEGLRHRLTQTP